MFELLLFGLLQLSSLTFTSATPAAAPNAATTQTSSLDDHGTSGWGEGHIADHGTSGWGEGHIDDHGTSGWGEGH
ncbi:hypothetical protein HNQ93_000367 [Hymenobacter luteus]|uniref:Secreted protein n=2 Tax=Hymenobacter TaxID=89966 RepID=A0A7W9SX51_9BACT|nr:MULTISPECIES: hypothetical protein [Hymenobacter]MBB4600153.1 hypothetical protein [Hymenobacter latericoloratus]MBB6057537.1 hypothetical protein [Hymenobacter luteus]